MNRKIAQKILEKQDVIAVQAVIKIYEKQSALVKNYNEIKRSKSVRDTKYHLQYLAEAVADDSRSLFLDYIDWASVIMDNIGIDKENFIQNLQHTKAAIIAEVGNEAADILNEYFSAAFKVLQIKHGKPVSFLQKENKFYQIAFDYCESLLQSDRRTASNIIMRAFESGISVKELYRYIFQPVQWEIGRLWQINEISVAQEHFCTAATQMIMSQLYPHIFNSSKNGKKFLAASVGSELHEIGVRMVADFFEMEGWDTYYLGANTPQESIIKTIKELEPDVLGLSSTITFNLKNIKEIINTIRLNGLDRKTKIMVGGYPFNVSKDLWKKMGADGYAPNAEEALKVAEKIS